MEKIEKVEYFIEDIDQLRIYDILEHLPTLPVVEYFDFTTIGLRTETPVYGRKGVKESASYTKDGLEIVRKTFIYEEDGVWIFFYWFDKNGDIGVEKVEFKPLNIVELHKVNKTNRDRTITYLQASAIGTPIENFVNELLKEYKEEVDLFVYNDTDDFINAVQNESRQPFLTYLNIVIQPPNENYPTGKTVRDSIIEQII